MAYIKYRPKSVEFYAPDTFERLGELSYCTTDSAAAAKADYVLMNNCDGALTLADSADSTAYGLANIKADGIATLNLSGVDTVRDRIGELEEQINDLKVVIQKLKESAGKGLKKSRMDKLRAELKTLRGAL